MSTSCTHSSLSAKRGRLEDVLQIKDLEVRTAQPLRDAIEDAVAQGLLVPADVRVLSYDLLLIAHSWALKHWYFAPLMDFGQFVRAQGGSVHSIAFEHERSTTALLARIRDG